MAWEAPVSWLSPIKQKTRVPSERLALLTGWAALGSRRDLEGSHRGGGMSRALLGCQEGKQSCPHRRPYSGSYALPSSCHDTCPRHFTHLHVSWRQEILLAPGMSASAPAAAASPDQEMCVENEPCARSPLPSGVRHVLRLADSPECPSSLPGVSLSAPTLQPPPVHSGPVWLPHASPTHLPWAWRSECRRVGLSSFWVCW